MKCPICNAEITVDHMIARHELSGHYDTIGVIGKGAGLIRRQDQENGRESGPDCLAPLK